jgi:hypothetical protein
MLRHQQTNEYVTVKHDHIEVKPRGIQPVTRINFEWRPSQAIANGAILLKESEAEIVDASDDSYLYDVRRTSVVICMKPEPSNQPFCVWRRTVGLTQLANGGYGKVEYCEAGGYHRDLEQALEDFSYRTEEGA